MCTCASTRTDISPLACTTENAAEISAAWNLPQSVEIQLNRWFHYTRARLPEARRSRPALGWRLATAPLVSSRALDSCHRDACRRGSASLTEFSVAADAQGTSRVCHGATVGKDQQHVARTVFNWLPAEGTGFALPAGRTTSIANHMPNDTTGRERPRRRGWDRRWDLGRRIVRDRRREAILVTLERRSAADRRSRSQRRSVSERRTSPPEGFHFLDHSNRDHSNRRGNPSPRGRMDKDKPGLGRGE
jgi:hypothetical protein